MPVTSESKAEITPQKQENSKSLFENNWPMEQQRDHPQSTFYLISHFETPWQTEALSVATGPGLCLTRHAMRKTERLDGRVVVTSLDK